MEINQATRIFGFARNCNLYSPFCLRQIVNCVTTVIRRNILPSPKPLYLIRVVLDNMGAQKPEETAVQDVDMEAGDSVDPEKLKLDADVLAVQVQSCQHPIYIHPMH